MFENEVSANKPQQSEKNQKQTKKESKANTFDY